MNQGHGKFPTYTPPHHYSPPVTHQIHHTLKIGTQQCHSMCVKLTPLCPIWVATAGTRHGFPPHCLVYTCILSCHTHAAGIKLLQTMHLMVERGKKYFSFSQKTRSVYVVRILFDYQLGSETQGRAYWGWGQHHLFFSFAWSSDLHLCSSGQSPWSSDIPLSQAQSVALPPWE